VQNIIIATGDRELPLYARIARTRRTCAARPASVQAARLSATVSSANPARAYPAEHHADHDRADVADDGLPRSFNAAGLSFIGLGVRPRNPSGASMVAEGAAFMVSAEWWIAFFPGLGA